MVTRTATAPLPIPPHPEGTADMLDFKDLAPTITRQRMVVEGYPTFVITDEHIKDYLKKLSDVTDMITIIEPVTHVSDLYGWAGWIHWETSGAHFYSWERPISFFSVDIYTCKAFDPQTVIDFTKEYFRTTELVAKEF
ncbi:S-adenosylmethionine decarboxylase [Actinoplanes sp. NPDC048791]